MGNMYGTAGPRTGPLEDVLQLDDSSAEDAKSGVKRSGGTGGQTILEAVVGYSGGSSVNPWLRNVFNTSRSGGDVDMGRELDLESIPNRFDLKIFIGKSLTFGCPIGGVVKVCSNKHDWVGTQAGGIGANSIRSGYEFHFDRVDAILVEDGSERGVIRERIQSEIPCAKLVCDSRIDITHVIML